jgi:hypothetical protein
MKMTDSMFLSGGTAEQQFNFSIPLPDVHRAHHGVKSSLREGAAPYIDALPVAAGSSLEVAVVQGIDGRGNMWMGEALGAIDYQL